MNSGVYTFRRHQGRKAARKANRQSCLKMTSCAIKSNQPTPILNIFPIRPQVRSHDPGILAHTLHNNWKLSCPASIQYGCCALAMAFVQSPGQGYITHKTYQIPPQSGSKTPKRAEYTRSHLENEPESLGRPHPRIVYVSKDRFGQEKEKTKAKPRSKADTKKPTARRGREKNIEIVDADYISPPTKVNRRATRTPSQSSSSDSDSASVSSSNISPNTSPPPPHSHHKHQHDGIRSQETRPGRELNRKRSILLSSPRGRSCRRSPSPTPSLLDPAPDPYIEGIRNSQRARSRGRGAAVMAKIDMSAPESASLRELSRRRRHVGERQGLEVRAGEEYERAHLPTQRRLVRRESFAREKPRAASDRDEEELASVVDIDVYESTSVPFRPRGRYRPYASDEDESEHGSRYSETGRASGRGHGRRDIEVIEAPSPPPPPSLDRGATVPGQQHQQHRMHDSDIGAELPIRRKPQHQHREDRGHVRDHHNGNGYGHGYGYGGPPPPSVGTGVVREKGRVYHVY